MPRTYVRKQSIAVNKSTLALNALFATNMAKQQLTTKNKQQKRRKRIIKIKDLPPTKTTELLDDNSIHLNCTNKDNTFDRLLAGENYKSVRVVKNAVNISEDNTSSFLPSIVLKSILQTSNDRLGSVRHITGSSILDISLEKIASWSDVSPDFITKRRGRSNAIVKAKNRIEDGRHNNRGACKITASPNKPRRFFHDEFAGFSKEECNVSKNFEKSKTDLLDSIGGDGKSPKRTEAKSKKKKLKSSCILVEGKQAIRSQPSRVNTFAGYSPGKIGISRLRNYSIGDISQRIETDLSSLSISHIRENSTRGFLPTELNLSLDRQFINRQVTNLNDHHLPKARNSHVPSSTPIRGKQPSANNNKKHNNHNNANHLNNNTSHLITSVIAEEEMTSMRDLSLSRIDVNNSISNNDNNDSNVVQLESDPRGKLVLNGREEIVIPLNSDEEIDTASLERIKSLRGKSVERVQSRRKSSTKDSNVRSQFNSGEKDSIVLSRRNSVASGSNFRSRSNSRGKSADKSIEKPRANTSNNTQSSSNNQTSLSKVDNRESTASIINSTWNNDSGNNERLRPRSRKSPPGVTHNCNDLPSLQLCAQRNVVVPIRFDGLMERTMSKITLRKRSNSTSQHPPPNKLPSPVKQITSTPIKSVEPIKISTEHITKRKKTQSLTKLLRIQSTPTSINNNNNNKPKHCKFFLNEPEMSLIEPSQLSTAVDKTTSFNASQSLAVEEFSCAVVDSSTPRKRRTSLMLLLEKSSPRMLEGSDELDEEVAGFHETQQHEWSKERKSPPVTRSRSRMLSSLGITTDDVTVDRSNKTTPLRKQRSYSVTPSIHLSESNTHSNWSYHTLHSSNPLDNRQTPLKSILKRTKSFTLDNRPNSTINLMNIKRNSDSDDDCVITSWKYKHSHKSKSRHSDKLRLTNDSGEKSMGAIRLISNDNVIVGTSGGSSKDSTDNELSEGEREDDWRLVDGLKREDFVFAQPVLKVIIPGKKYRRSMRQSRLVDEKRESTTGNVFTSVRRSSIKLSPIKSKVIGHDTVDSKKKQLQHPVNVVGAREEQQQSVFEELLANLSLVHGNNNHSNRRAIRFIDESCVHAADVVNEEGDRGVIGANEDRSGSFVSELDRGTARDLVLRKCGQREPELWEKYYPESLLKNCRKIGEGVYGEVFLFRNAQKTTSVMKVIPIEGNTIVNGEHQKKYGDIISEIVIAMELSNLRNNPLNTTSCFSKLQAVRCVQGQYPDRLLDLWQLYDEDRGSENDSPEVFTQDQLYIVLELADGGKDLESYVFNNAQQAYYLFVQTACALAVAEGALEFEHRDLHWGNILISRCDRDVSHTYLLDGREMVVPSDGVQVCIIDFTLSRMTVDEVCIYNDLALDPDLFTADGDLQFDVYRKMQQLNGNDWKPFKARSNIFWLDYILDKMMREVRYQDKTTKLHMTYVKKLKRLRKVILTFNSVTKFVQSTRFDYS